MFIVISRSSLIDITLKRTVTKMYHLLMRCWLKANTRNTSSTIKYTERKSYSAMGVLFNNYHWTISMARAVHC